MYTLYVQCMLENQIKVNNITLDRRGRNMSMIVLLSSGMHIIEEVLKYSNHTIKTYITHIFQQKDTSMFLTSVLF